MHLASGRGQTVCASDRIENGGVALFGTQCPHRLARQAPPLTSREATMVLVPDFSNIPEERGAEAMAAIHSGNSVVDYDNRSVIWHSVCSSDRLYSRCRIRILNMSTTSCRLRPATGSALRANTAANSRRNASKSI